VPALRTYATVELTSTTTTDDIRALIRQHWLYGEHDLRGLFGVGPTDSSSSEAGILRSWKRPPHQDSRHAAGVDEQHFGDVGNLLKPVEGALLTKLGRATSRSTL
jgi:hypothetical protein